MSNYWDPTAPSDPTADDSTPWRVPQPIAWQPADWQAPPSTGSSYPPPVAAPGNPHRGWIAVAAVASVAALVVTGVGIHAVGSHRAAVTSSSPVTVPGGATSPNLPQGSGQFGLGPSSGGDSTGGDPGNQPAFGYPGQTGDSGTAASGTATDAQQVGIVDVNTVLGLQGAQAAGTGMVLTSSGEILTNNHVIDGATNITVTVVATGATYTAKVVGYDPTQDVAVLQAVGASGLPTITPAQALPAVGATVTAVGNAGGAGGVPSTATGSVVALGQTITATDDNGANPEQLTQLIESDAPIAAGDSGGPLYDSNNQVLGMDTAASSAGSSQAFTIPISRALAVADEISQGQASSTVHIGTTAMLGVAVQPGTLSVVSVQPGSPAESAGLVAGDTIESVDGTPVTSSTGLQSVLSALSPGQTVSLGFADQAGTTHSVQLTLAPGPAR